MHSFALLSAAAALMACASAAPTSTPQISCDYAGVQKAEQLSSGDYNYGSGSVSLGYKSYPASEGGDAVLRVVNADPNDPSITALSDVTRVQCNSTSLNYFSAPSVFNAETPYKLQSGVSRNGVQLCVALNDPANPPSEVILAPCSSQDTEDAQLGQFWAAHWKYNNLLPLSAPSDSKVLGEENSNNILWPLFQPDVADGQPQPYSAEPYNCNYGDGCNAQTYYHSFM